MDELEAARQRHSVRHYTSESISDEHIGLLNDMIDKINQESGLSIKLVLNEPKAFKSLALKAIGFTGAVNYIAIIGPDEKDLNEKSGYYGEKLVLYAQSLGLRTCWALLCSKKHVDVPEGQRFSIGISIGYGATDGRPHKNKDVSSIADVDGSPEWFAKGIECVMLAPSGRNKQPISFSEKDGKVFVSYKPNALTRIDCGIAKYHFELGAGKKNFEWAD